MSEVEKMMQNTGIDYEERYNNCTLNKEGECKLKCSCDICKYSEEKYIYPPFTAEKQIELIKWLMNYPMLDEISLFFNEPSKTFNLRVYSLPEIGDFRSTYTETQNNFEDMLCGLINNLWQDLTSEEKQQIKEVLK